MEKLKPTKKPKNHIKYSCILKDNLTITYIKQLKNDYIIII